MARVSRKNMSASYIHMITQGIDRENIFKNPEYKNEYIKLVKEMFGKYNSLCLLCYCIMDNHAHFLVYMKDYKELSKAMARINTTYGIFYNKRENRVGYVFRNRYYTQPIKNEEHLYNAVVYIHRNPVKAKLVKEMREYEYSSYQQYQQENIEEKCIQLLFQTQNYKEKFDFIHKNFREKRDIFDIDEIPIDIKEIEEFVEKYCKKIGVDKREIRENNYLIIKVAQELKKEYACKNKEIAKILGIGKNRIIDINKKQRIEGLSPKSQK